MNIDDTREEILNRTERLKQRREKRIVQGLKGTAVALAMLLVAIIPFLPMSGSVGDNNGNYATLVLGSEAGAYILVGIICFLIGVIVTLLAVRRRENNKQ